VGIGSGAGGSGDVAASLDDPIECAAIYDQVLDHRERIGPPRFDIDDITVGERAHV
jgi:hypothetical protein